MDSQETVGQRVRRLRKEARLSQARLAERICRSDGLVSRIENGLRNLSPSTATLVAEVVGCRPEYLLEASQPFPDAIPLPILPTQESVIGLLTRLYPSVEVDRERGTILVRTRET